MLLFFLSFVLSEPTICFSETKLCGFVDTTDLLIVDLNDPDVYDEINNFVAHKKEIWFCFNAKPFLNTYEVEIPLSLFINREIYLFYGDSTIRPKSIVFTYQEFEDFSSTSIYNYDYEISFYYMGNHKDIVELKFNAFCYEYEIQSILLPSEQNVKLSVNTLHCTTHILLNFYEVSVLDDSNAIGIVTTENTIISFFSDRFDLTSIGKETTVINELKAAIDITALNGISNLELIANVTEESQSLPVINIAYIYYLIFSGLWPNDKSEILNTITITDPTYLLLIDIKCEYLPFNVNALMVYFDLYNHFNLLGQLISTYDAAFVKANSSIEIVNVHLSYAESSINTNTADLNLTIDRYKYMFKNGYKQFSIAFTFNDKHISHVVIKDVEMSGLANRISHYNFINTMISQPSDEDIKFLLSGNNSFLQMPKIHFVFWETTYMTYTAYSKPIDGLNNIKNILKLRIDDSSSIISISTYGTESLKRVETNLCIGSTCLLYQDPSDLASSFIFNENANRFFVFLYSPAENFVIGLHNIPNKDLILRVISAPNFYPINVTFIFPPTNDTIASCKIDFIQRSCLIGFNKFVAKHLLFNNVLSNDTTYCEFECDYVESDIISLGAIMKIDYLKNLTVHTEYTEMVYIGINNEVVIVGDKSITWNKVGNLTIVGRSFYFSAVSTKPIPTFYIVCSSEPADITFVGNWKDAKFEDSIHIHANGFQTTLNIMQPFNHEEIRLHGDGKFSIKYLNTNTARICIYDKYSLFCGDKTAMAYVEFTQIESFSAYRIEINLDNFQEKVLHFDLSKYQTKQVSFISLYNDNLKVEVTPPSGDQKLSEFIFEKIDLIVNTTDDNISFNYLTLINSKIHSVGTLVVECLTYSYDNLVGWEEVFIEDTIVVSGTIPKEAFKVTMLNDVKDYTDELSVSYPGDLEFGDASLKVNNGTFLFREDHK